MKSICTTFSLLLLYFNLVAQEVNPSDMSIQNEVDTWLEETNVPGIAIAKIENGKVVQTILKGTDEDSNPITSKTIFDVASLTKTITTLAILKLADNEEIDLDEPLYKYWIDPDVKEDIRHQKLTSKLILSHKSGFKNWRYMYEDNKLSFDFEPGEKFQYSGEGFEYLRNALERKFDIPFEKLIDSLVFKPIGMENSSLVWNTKITNLNFAGSHDNEGKAYDYKKSYKANAADNLLTNLLDFSKLTEALINNSYLSSSLFEEMGKTHTKVRDGISFGLGWIVFQNLSNNEYALFNAGSDEGVNSLIVILPKSNRGLIVMTNGDNGRGLAMKAIQTFLDDTGIEIVNRF